MEEDNASENGVYVVTRQARLKLLLHAGPQLCSQFTYLSALASDYGCVSRKLIDCVSERVESRGVEEAPAGTLSEYNFITTTYFVRQVDQ